MSFLGASRDELLFVAFIVILVVAAPKIPKVGEWIGGLLSSLLSSGKGGAPGDEPDEKKPRR